MVKPLSFKTAKKRKSAIVRISGQSVVKVPDMDVKIFEKPWPAWLVEDASKAAGLEPDEAHKITKISQRLPGEYDVRKLAIRCDLGRVVCRSVRWIVTRSRLSIRPMRCKDLEWKPRFSERTWNMLRHVDKDKDNNRPSNLGWQEGRVSSKGYWRVNTKGKEVHGHRLVMEQYLGRELGPHETVHHKDGNKLNNDISNLELWDRDHPSGVRQKDLEAWTEARVKANRSSAHFVPKSRRVEELCWAALSEGMRA